jgi:hypothetical protein
MLKVEKIKAESVTDVIFFAYSRRGKVPIIWKGMGEYDFGQINVKYTAVLALTKVFSMGPRKV